MSGGWVATAGLRFVERKIPIPGSERPGGIYQATAVRILQQKHVEFRDPQTNWVNPPETKWIDVPLVKEEP